MQGPTDGNQISDNEEETYDANESAELTADAQAADAWSPDPDVPMDFKATMAATKHAEVNQPDTPAELPGRLNTTWLTLGVLLAFCLGIMFYIATKG